MTKGSFSFPDLLEVLYKILETATDDVIGLYETFWSLPEGEITDPALGFSKKYPLISVCELNALLISKGYVNRCAGGDLRFSPVDDTSVLADAKNYLPFRIGSDQGYVLLATQKGAILRQRIARRSPWILRK